MQFAGSSLVRKPDIYNPASEYTASEWSVSDVVMSAEDASPGSHDCPYNRPPVFHPITDYSVPVRESLTFDVTAEDYPDEDSISLWASVLPNGASFDSVTADAIASSTFNWADVQPPGDHVVQWTASDRNGSASKNITIHTIDQYDTQIDGAFDGYKKDRVYKMQNGDFWQQTSLDNTVASLYAPSVAIYYDLSRWELEVEGLTDITVSHLPSVLDTRLDGVSSRFTGYGPDKTYELKNGEFWQQVSSEQSAGSGYGAIVWIWEDGSSVQMHIGDEDENITVQHLPDARSGRMYTDFSGFHYDNLYALTDGTVWEQVDTASSSVTAETPDIVMWPYGSSGQFKMQVYDGGNFLGSCIVASRDDLQIIQSRIDGSLKRFAEDRWFKLENGQVWQQTSSTSYELSSSVYHPNVVLTKQGSADWVMTVEGMPNSINVQMDEDVVCARLSTYNGYGDNNIYELDNGEFWQQDSSLSTTGYGIDSSPWVFLWPYLNYTKMYVADEINSVRVDRLAGAFSSNIASPFSGMSSGNLYVLENGEVWRQDDNVVANGSGSPHVVIWDEYGYRMQISSSYGQVIGTTDVSLEASGAQVLGLDGTFTGFYRNNLYQLDNGEVWKQVSFENTSASVNDPDVALWPDGSNYRMTVYDRYGDVLGYCLVQLYSAAPQAAPLSDPPIETAQGELVSALGESAEAPSYEGPVSNYLPEWQAKPFLNCVHKTVHTDLTDENNQDVYVYYDGMGREIQSRVETERNDDSFRVNSTVYDEQGRITEAFEPSFEQGGDFVAFDVLSNPSVTYQYDALGRVTKMIPRTGDSGSPTAPSTTVYEEGNDPWAVVATDALGHVHKSFNDAHGRVTHVQDFLNGSPVETQYKYDLLGRLWKTIDPEDNEIVLSYDSLDRKTSMDDPDMGVWNYQYDDAGRLKSQEDAVGNRTTFDYDGLSRIWFQHVYDASSALIDEVEYEYDVSDDADFTVYDGQLYRITQNGVTIRYSYDDHGNVRKEETQIAGIGTYVTETNYDELDRPLSIGYPNGEAAIQYNYGPVGNVEGVSGLSGAGQDGVQFYHVDSFNELGQIERATYGNGIESRFSYYSNSHRLRQSSTRRVNGKAYQNLSYTYDAGGLIRSINDSLRTGEESSTYEDIEYDDLYRLKSAKYGVASPPQSYSYDVLGNIVNNGEYGSETYQYNGSRPHAVTAIGDEDFQYDNNGNIKNAMGRELTFDAFNRLVTVEMDDGTETRFRYLADGTRYLKEVISGGQVNTTVYIGDAYEEQRFATGQINKLCHVFFGDKRVASFTPVTGDGRLASVVPGSDSKRANAGLLVADGGKKPRGENTWTRVYARNGTVIRYVSRLAPRTLFERLAPAFMLIAVILFFVCLQQSNRALPRFKVKGVVGYRTGQQFAFIREMRNPASVMHFLRFFAAEYSFAELWRSLRSFAVTAPSCFIRNSEFNIRCSTKKALCTVLALTFFFSPCFAQSTFARGDVNGDQFVDIADALLIQQVVDGKREMDSAVFQAGYHNGDVNYDGVTNATDARIIMEYATGLRDLPEAPLDGDGNEFTPQFLYYHADHLGSVNIVTDRYGEIVQHVEYTPFGETRQETNLGVSVNHLYTGQLLDRETGLYYYNARYYDSKIGHFISPDSMIPDLSDSQQFNRYSYVLNNPLMLTDPTGHEIQYYKDGIPYNEEGIPVIIVRPGDRPSSEIDLPEFDYDDLDIGVWDGALEYDFPDIDMSDDFWWNGVVGAAGELEKVGVIRQSYINDVSLLKSLSQHDPMRDALRQKWNSPKSSTATSSLIYS